MALPAAISPNLALADIPATDAAPEPKVVDWDSETAQKCIFADCCKLTDVKLASENCSEAFGAHSDFIRLTSSNILPQESGSEESILQIKLKTSPQAFKLMLEYLHLGTPFPDTAMMEHSTFMEVAEAALEYDLHFAKEVCKLRMSLQEYESHPFQVINFAAKKQDRFLLDKASRKALPLQWSMVLDPKLKPIWSTYSEQYTNILESLIAKRPLPTSHFQGRGCKTWKRCVGLIKNEASQWLRDERLLEAPNFQARMRELASDILAQCPAGSCNSGAVTRWWQESTGDRYYTGDPVAFSTLVLDKPGELSFTI